MEYKYYQIGDLAKILNISRQMIRYYEECGVIKPVRIPGNNYRLYTAMDYFALADAICLSNLGVNIKDIVSFKRSDYSSQIVGHLEQFVSDTEQDIRIKQLLIRRAEQIMENMEAASMNVNNFWVKKIPEHVLYPLMRSKNDIYDELITPECIMPELNKGENIVFGNGLVEFNESDEFWWININSEFTKYLNIPETPECKRVPEQYCLCTVMDMGEIGSFDSSKVRELQGRAAEMGYQSCGKIYGLLLGRGEENGHYHRYLEIRIPVKP